MPARTSSLLIRAPGLRLLPLLALFLVALCSAPATAQTTSTMRGTVLDAGGGVLPGAQVTATSMESGLVRTTVTGGDGRFVLALVPVGAYEVRADLSGFRPMVRRGVEVTVGETVVLDFTLEVGGVDEAVTVVGRVPLVDTQSGDLSYLVSEQTIEALPLNGRNYTDLAFLQPGVVAFRQREGGSVVAHGTGASINGQDPRSNVYLLDGTLQNDFTNGPAGSAAGTTLGLETVREFRVETNAYSAEFGRNSGGQINVLTKSGTNEVRGTLYGFHRNDALDARNFFDGPVKPDFTRNQFGATVGGPVQPNRTFFFVGYEGLRENLGRTISTIVPDENARLGLVPDPARPGSLLDVGVHPAVRPYLNEFPRPNGPAIGGGLAEFTFPFDQEIMQHFVQGRIDWQPDPRHQVFARYTFDDADQLLPTDFPQFPRAFVSRNQFFTGEYRRVESDRTLSTFRVGFSRTRIGQTVEANVGPDVLPFVTGRPSLGNIDIGGIPRFGPQTSADVSLVQNVYSFDYGLVQTRGAHLLKAGALVERYQDNMVNPTFSRGIYRFGSLQTFLQNRPAVFIGLTPEGELDRYWRFTLFGFYLQDDVRLGDRLTLNAGLRYEFTTTPEEIRGRDAALIDLSDAEPTLGQLYQNPTYTNLSPRLGFAWDPFGTGTTALRGGYGLYFNTNNQQNLIVTVTNPPFTPRAIIGGPTFPNPPFERAGTTSIRPIQWDLENPRLHVWNVSLQRELAADTAVTIGYAGSRGTHLLRSSDVNVPTPQVLADGTIFFPPDVTRPNPAFSTIELKSSDGESWYNALILEVRRRWRDGLSFQSSYTLSHNEDTTQASTFFSDATNGTTSAFPEFPGLDYNKGLADYHARHNWVVNVTWDVPFARRLDGVAGALLDGWQVVGIGQVRSGHPLTVFVQANRSRSQWAPSLAPGVGQDRPSYAPGRNGGNAVLGRVDQWFDPTAFVLPARGTVGNVGRGSLIGPDLRVFDLAFVKRARWPQLGSAGRLELRMEIFNVFNRANFGDPSLIAFAGVAENEQPLASFGRIRSTITSARQIQFGVRVVF